MRNIAIIGLGGFGSALARELTEKGVEVLAIDQKREPVEAIKDTVTHAVTLNSTDEEALCAVDIQNVDVAVVCIGKDIEANLLTTILLKKLGIHRIWTRALGPLQQEIIKTLEVENIINLEEEMGSIVASSLASANIVRHIPLSKGHSIIEVKLAKDFVGKTLRTLDLRNKYSVNVIAIKRKVPAITDQGERILEDLIDDIPNPDDILNETDSLLVVGSTKNVEHFSTR
ncbi:MAG: TrkA family potassium uptake protein [Verrucomicrobiota bacterium]|nr:TrkA family potassium uptake protein [Verrucomicrobiota bacterium]